MLSRLVPLLLLIATIGQAATISFGQLDGEDVSGNRQVGEAGLGLARPLTVQVTRNGVPLVGVPVRFSVLSQPLDNYYGKTPARLADTLVLTDRLGFARTRLSLGATAGDYRIRAATAEDEVVFDIVALRRRWYLLTIVEMLGGLTLFLFGLYYGSKGLRRLAGNRVRELLFSLTANRILGALSGIGVTVIFQSSSATITLLVGMARAGLLSLGQSLGVILGADIGTTVTVQILAFRLFDYAIIVAVLGFVLMNSWRRLRNIGQAVFGFGLVFWSLKVVLTAADPLRYVPQVASVVAAVGRVPWLALLFAVLFTGLIRSSAATIGIIVGLSFAGLVDLKTAVPFILGANVGTCFNAILASWRGGIEAKRIAAGHLLFKLVTVGLVMPFLPFLVRLFSLTASAVPRQIANAHTLINVMAAVVFLPLLGGYERLLRRLVPDRASQALGPRYLDLTALEAPEVAVAQACREVLRMGDRVLELYRAALPVFLNNDKEGRRRIVAGDDEVDRLEGAITGFLARVSQEELSPALSRRTVALFYVTDELEHIADVVSKNIMAHCRKKMEEGLAFSAEGLAEIGQFHAEVEQSLTQAIAALATWDRKLAIGLVERRAWGVERRRELHDRHLGRLSQGLKETMDTSSVHLDMIADIERINFHCSQIGQAVLNALGGSGPTTKDTKAEQAKSAVSS